MVLLAALAGAVGASAAAAPKYIYSGWDLGDVSPQEVLMMADKFDKAPCDGVALKIGGSMPGHDCFRYRHLATDPGWKYEEVAPFEPVFREIVKHPSLRESLLSFNMAPTNRLTWTDDAAWAAFAKNVAVMARLAKRGGLKGVITDFEDYWKQKQYRYDAGKDGGTYASACKLARQRGREVFRAMFGEYPEISILTFQLLTTGGVYCDRRDPVDEMIARRDLWPAFVNGILDVMPPTARLTDGNEDGGYLGRAERGDFYRRVADLRVGVLPLVAKENRAKYRAQVDVGFGLYVDSYQVATNSAYYMGPENGKRIHRFESNLRQATACADGYIWFWGERGFCIDWPQDLKERSGNASWRSSGKGTWARKYFTGRWGRIRPWRDQLDGDFDLMLAGVKDPARCVRDAFAGLASVTNLYRGKLRGSAQVIDMPTVRANEWYGVRVKGRGEYLRMRSYFKDQKGWRWDLGHCAGSFGPADAEGWREGVNLVCIPAGAMRYTIHLDGGEAKLPVEFGCLEVIRIR